MKLSHWYDSDINPVHIGLYEVWGGWCVWSGGYWEFVSFVSAENAIRFWQEGCGESCIQNHRWRGIVK